MTDNELADAIERLTRERDQERHARQLHSAEIARLTIERDEARGGREARHRAWLEAKARIAELTRERDEAQRENMDMVWQRRSAEFRAKAAEARITKLEAALDSLLRDQHGRL
jgi:chromosome segregation ATPase